MPTHATDSLRLSRSRRSCRSGAAARRSTVISAPPAPKNAQSNMGVAGCSLSEGRPGPFTCMSPKSMRPSTGKSRPPFGHECREGTRLDVSGRAGEHGRSAHRRKT